MTDKLLPTVDAAKAIGVNRGTLVRWWQEGLVTPEIVTAGGHGRWNVDDLRDELRKMRQRDD